MEDCPAMSRKTKRIHPELKGEQTEEFKRGVLAAAQLSDEIFAHLPRDSKWRRAATVISKVLKEKVGCDVSTT